jgi:hypothetical protein
MALDCLHLMNASPFMIPCAYAVWDTVPNAVRDREVVVSHNGLAEMGD